MPSESPIGTDWKCSQGHDKCVNHWPAFDWLGRCIRTTVPPHSRRHQRSNVEMVGSVAEWINAYCLPDEEREIENRRQREARIATPAMQRIRRSARGEADADWSIAAESGATITVSGTGGSSYEGSTYRITYDGQEVAIGPIRQALDRSTPWIFMGDRLSPEEVFGD